MEKQITFQRFSPRQNGDLMPQLVNCYREVFAEEPWREWKKCQVCGKQWGINEIPQLTETDFSHCAKPLVDFWPVNQLEQDFRKIITDSTSCWIALVDAQLIGFIIGYTIKLEKLEEKLQLPGLSKKIRERFGEIDEVIYQADIGVKRSYRKQKIATRLFRLRMADFRRLNLKVGLARVQTNPPSVTYLWYHHKLKYEIIAEYNEPQKRVILARTLHDLNL